MLLLYCAMYYSTALHTVEMYFYPLVITYTLHKTKYRLTWYTNWFFTHITVMYGQVSGIATDILLLIRMNGEWPLPWTNLVGSFSSNKMLLLHHVMDLMKYLNQIISDNWFVHINVQVIIMDITLVNNSWQNLSHSNQTTNIHHIYHVSHSNQTTNIHHIDHVSQDIGYME